MATRRVDPATAPGAASPAGAAPPATPSAPGVPYHVRQGDVLLVRVDVDLKGARHVRRDGDRVILAYGEVTGHAHAIREQHAELRTIGGHRYLRAPVPFTLEHEEHAPLTLEPGTYEVVIQREYVPAEVGSRSWRQVVD
jgi:hypothetical protein